MMAVLAQIHRRDGHKKNTVSFVHGGVAVQKTSVQGIIGKIILDDFNFHPICQIPLG